MSWLWVPCQPPLRQFVPPTFPPPTRYAHLLARTLDRHGLACFSGLHVAGGQNWRQYFEKLERAEVMLAVCTPAFYDSGPCLEEMTQANKHGLSVPLSFGGAAGSFTIVALLYFI